MLAYLDALCAALLARNTAEIARLLAHPLAEKLPRRVREEALGISQLKAEHFRAPIQTLHFYYQMTHLLDATTDADAFQSAPAEQVDDGGQIELPLGASGCYGEW